MNKFSYALVILGVFFFAFDNVIAKETSQSSNKVPGQYIVVFNDSIVDADSTTNEIVSKNGLGLINKYGHAIKGFSAKIPDVALKAIANDKRVKFISEDRIVNAIAKPGTGTPAPQPAEVVPTGISRIGANGLINKGAGIGVAVIDTGIDLTHPDLKANLSSYSKTCVSRTRSANDDNGHGTHVAGTIAGLDNEIGVVGVAPEAKLFAVKVLDRNGSGTWSSVICGIDWVTANAESLGIKVANMSLGGSGNSDNACGTLNNDALHVAVCRASQKVTFVVAAGNDGGNANNFVPAAYDDAVITVSALTDTDGQAGGLGGATSYGADDTFASFSNYGSNVVDLGAPGVNIRSTWKGGAYNTISGTSMASPHVAGVAALYLSKNGNSSWTVVRDALKSLAEQLNSSTLHPEPIVNASSL